MRRWSSPSLSKIDLLPKIGISATLLSPARATSGGAVNTARISSGCETTTRVGPPGRSVKASPYRRRHASSIRSGCVLRSSSCSRGGSGGPGGRRHAVFDSRGEITEEAGGLAGDTVDNSSHLSTWLRAVSSRRLPLPYRRANRICQGWYARAVRNLAARAGSGDDGRTVLLAGGRISKDDPLVETYGTVDETSSAIGIGKTLAQTPRVREVCEELQRGLYTLGAQLATGPEAKRSYGEITAEHVDRIEELSRQIEEETPQLAEMTGFILPGTVPASAHLDLARAVARRAERRLVGLGDVDEKARRWLNRLSLLLFLLARHEEAQVGHTAAPARTDG